MHMNVPTERSRAERAGATCLQRRSVSGLAFALLASAAACQADAPTGADLPVETPETDSGPEAAVVPDLAPNQLVTTSLTNQPSGFTPIAEWAATSLWPLGTTATSGYGIISGKWGRWYNATSTASDGSAPKSSSSTLQFRWPKGLAAGSSPGMVTAWTATSGTEYSKIYESGWVKIPSADFEQHRPSIGLKMFGFWAAGRKNYSNSQNYGWTRGPQTNPVSGFQFVMKQQQITDRAMSPNVGHNLGTYYFTAGKWHRYEIVMEINTIGKADGKFRMWWNGVKTHDYSNVVWRTSTYPAKFFARKWDPVWGGAGGSAKTRDDRLLVDHLYISGVR
jgi:hypothetical protein